MNHPPSVFRKAQAECMQSFSSPVVFFNSNWRCSSFFINISNSSYVISYSFDDSMDRLVYNYLVTGTRQAIILESQLIYSIIYKKFVNKANVYRTRSPDRGTKSMPSPPSPIEISAEHRSVLQRFSVAAGFGRSSSCRQTAYRCKGYSDCEYPSTKQ